MGGLRKSLFSVLISLGAVMRPTDLPAQSQPDLIAVIASCTGRLSAVMEYQWLVQDPGSDDTRIKRDAMAELLRAVTPPGDVVRAMGVRLDAKRSQTVLLQAALFGADRTRSGWAARRADHLLRTCAALLVS
jgi:hypothetical protein